MGFEGLALLDGFARDDRGTNDDIAKQAWIQAVYGIRPGKRKHIGWAGASTIALVERSAFGFRYNAYGNLTADLGL